MRVNPHFFLFLGFPFQLTVISVKGIQRINHEDVENIGRIDLMQPDLGENNLQSLIHTPHHLEVPEQSLHTHGEGHTHSVQAHLEVIEQYLMQDEVWDETVQNSEMNAESKDLLQDHQRVNLDHLNNIPMHRSLEQEQEQIHDNHHSKNQVDHSSHERKIMNLAPAIWEGSVPENSFRRILEVQPLQKIQDILKYPNSIHKLKSLNQQEFLALLQRAGRFAINLNKGIYKMISHSLEMLKQSANEPLSKDQDLVCDIQQLQAALENINFDFITAYLGGLMIIFKDIDLRPSPWDLMSDGWNIFVQELRGELFHTYNDHFDITKSSKPTSNNRMRDLFEPLGGSVISAELIINLVNIWAEKTSYTPHSHGIDLQEFTFKKGACSVGKGKKRKYDEEGSSQDMIYGVTASENIETLGTTFMNTNKDMYLELSDTCVNFLINLGTWGIKLPKILLNKITSFFPDLEEKILNGLLVTGPTPSNPEQIPTSINSGFMKWRVSNAIRLMQRQILPAFLATLWLTHQTHVKNTSWISMCKSGWSFLEGFFSSSKGLVLTYPTSLLKQPDRTGFEWKEWSNNQDPIHCIKSIQDNGHTTQETIWHLVNQWYKKLNAQPGSMIRALGYIIDPPSFLVIQDIYTKHQKALRQVKFKRKTSTSPTMKQDDQMLPFSPSQVSGRFLCQFWRWKKQTKGEFSTQIEKFFTSLEINLYQAFDTAQKLYQHNQLRDLSSTSILNKHMIHNAIITAEEQIVPQFISTVLLLYKDKDQNKVWNTVCGSGWDFLQTYFSEWETLFLERPQESMIVENRRRNKQIDWSDSRSSFHYMATHSLHNSTPEKPAWFLVQQWYQKLVGPMRSTYLSLGFNISPPNKYDLKRIMDEYRC